MFTYNFSPSTIPRDEVRFLMGDTDNTDFLVHDEEIAYALTAENDNARLAAVRILRSLAAKYAKLMDKSVGDLRISYSQRYRQLKEMADDLQTNELNPMLNSSLSPTPYAGGISVADKDTVEDDTDRVNPSFSRGMHDNPTQSDDRDECDRT